MLEGAAHCRDTYQGWISLYWVPFPCHPHGHPQGKSLPLGPDQQVGQHHPQCAARTLEAGPSQGCVPSLQAGLMLSPPQHLQ